MKSLIWFVNRGYRSILYMLYDISLKMEKNPVTKLNSFVFNIRHTKTFLLRIPIISWMKQTSSALINTFVIFAVVDMFICYCPDYITYLITLLSRKRYPLVCQSHSKQNTGRRNYVIITQYRVVNVTLNLSWDFPFIIR